MHAGGAEAGEGEEEVSRAGWCRALYSKKRSLGFLLGVWGAVEG